MWLIADLYHSEDTDKVYFRKKDEVSEYAEFMFKSKVLTSKKWDTETTIRLSLLK